jgi:hypothetical protein
LNAFKSKVSLMIADRQEDILNAFKNIEFRGETEILLL